MALPELTKALAEFAVERNWDKFHSPKNFAMALMVEAGELMDPLQWCGHEESRELVKNPEVKEYLTKEVGDILINILQFARWCDIDAEAAAWSKLEKLKKRYDPTRISGDSFTRVQESTGESMFKTLSGTDHVAKKVV
jgi:NTP pyrophosphatase (non-canonical NTP hydrolase)